MDEGPTIRWHNYYFLGIVIGSGGVKFKELVSSTYSI
jgi:hypothetical protein